jgi:hypothetical protein
VRLLGARSDATQVFAPCGLCKCRQRLSDDGAASSVLAWSNLDYEESEFALADGARGLHERFERRLGLADLDV